MVRDQPEIDGSGRSRLYQYSPKGINWSRCLWTLSERCEAENRLAQREACCCRLLAPNIAKPLGIHHILQYSDWSGGRQFIQTSGLSKYVHQCY